MSEADVEVRVTVASSALELDEWNAKTNGTAYDATRHEIPTGSKVRIIAGRYRDSVGTLAGVAVVDTPTGSKVRIAVVKRPRAGQTLVFSHEIEKA